MDERDEAIIARAAALLADGAARGLLRALSRHGGRGALGGDDAAQTR
jgi:hypothetical protein